MRLYETEFYVYNKKLQDLIGHAEDVPLKVTIDLERIIRIAQWTADDDDLNILENHCMLYIEDGTSLLIGVSYEKMVRIWKGESVV